MSRARSPKKTPLRQHAKNLRREIAAYTIPALPEPLRTRIVPPEYNWTHRDLKDVATGGPAPTRLLIARANYAGQAYQWARGAETLPGVSAANLHFLRDGDYTAGPSDFAVKKTVGEGSHIWARRQRKAIQDSFTHVLIEAELPILSPLYEGDLVQEVRELQDAGIKVALVSHGTDTRLPSLHRELEPYSPFHGDLDGLTRILEDKVQKNLEVMDELDLPEFVSTPDLLQFRPDAQWLPLVIDPDIWLEPEPTRLTNEKLVVAHVPGGQPAFKGTPSITPALQRLHDESLIEYVELRDVPFAEMPKRLAEADIVVNQVDMGLYAAVAVEAMLSGRVVVSQVWDSVRQHIRSQTGTDLPVVEANRTNLYDVIKDIAINREKYRDIGQKSREFALAAHSREQAGLALREFLES